MSPWIRLGTRGPEPGNTKEQPDFEDDYPDQAKDDAEENVARPTRGSRIFPPTRRVHEMMVCGQSLRTKGSNAT